MLMRLAHMLTIPWCGVPSKVKSLQKCEMASAHLHEQ